MVLYNQTPLNMPPLYIISYFLLLFISSDSPKKIPEREFLKCYGYSPCAACSNCNYCAHCKGGGGTCGVCKPGLKTGSKKDTVGYVPNYKPKQNYSSQCQAITKKGTRCSRSSRSNGYCWQHGG
jgi:hypothetical protein